MWEFATAFNLAKGKRELKEGLFVPEEILQIKKNSVLANHSQANLELWKNSQILKRQKG